MSKRTPFLLLLLLAVAVLGGCGDSSKGSNVELVSDSGSPDGPVVECKLTQCGDLCVNTSSNAMHCGGCDMACKSPGQICSGSLPCSCPDPFLTSDLTSGGSQILEQMGVKVGLAPVFGSAINVFIVVYEPDNDLGVPYDLEKATSSLAPPAVAAGYDVDLATMTVHTAYAPTSGTLTLTTACDEGVSGSIENVTFTEVGGVLDPSPVADGCSFTVEALTFEIGDTCAVEMDGGVGDSDAGL